MQSLVAGRLEDRERDEVLSHVEGCEACRRVLAVMINLHSDTATPGSVARAPAAAPAPTAGRFELREEVGAGGLGVVFEAFDPVLHRKVAIKLVRAGLFQGPNSQEHRERLIREARAMAQVSHPNVVPVYEAGSQGDDVYIAMELVTGGTLKAWLSTPRTTAEVLERFLEAGEGLAAAHAIGLVHRDFKPDNVLVDALGRARVADFGLARGSLQRVEASAVSPDSLASTLTVPGALVGTPAYMAPEQLEGKPVDARADQFSFCVALYEALWGARPHSGCTVKELLASIRAGQWAPPKGRRPPEGAVRAAVLKGLAARPEGRFESMDALLAQLRPKPARRGLWAVAGVAAAVALAVLGVGGNELRRRAVERECAGGRARLEPAWTAERRAGLEKAFGAVQHPYAAGALAQTLAALDAWTARWAAGYGEACRAARLDGLQSSQVMDLRFACLGARRGELDALVSQLSRIDAAALVKAPVAADGLGRVELCADTAFLLAAVKGPRSDASPEAQAVRALARDTAALTDLGRLDDAKARGQEAVALAGKSSRRGLEAEAWLALGRALAARRGKDEAVEALEKAAEGALASGFDEVAVAAWRQLAFSEGYDQSKFDAAFKRLALAQAAVERLGSPRSLQADLDFTRGAVQLKQGALPEAEGSLLKALDAYRSSPEGHLAVARTLNNLATVKSQQDDLPASIRYQQEALTAMTRVLGDAHPTVALLTMNMGVDQLTGGDAEAALATFDRALALVAKAFGPEHPSVFASRLNRGKALTALRRYGEARESLEQALDGMKQAKAPPDDVAQALQSLAVNASAVGDYRRALALDEESLSLREASVGKDAAFTGVSANNTGNALLMLGRPKDALPLYQRALDIFAKTLPKGHTYVGHAAQGKGAALLALGRPKDALAPLAEARVIVEREEKTPGSRTVGVMGFVARAQAQLGQAKEALAALEAVEPAVAALPPMERGQHFAAKAEVLWAAKQLPAARAAAAAAAAALKEAGAVADPEAGRLAAWQRGHR